MARFGFAPWGGGAGAGSRPPGWICRWVSALGVWLALWLAACGGPAAAPMPTPTPTPPTWVVVAHSTDLVPADAALGACARQLGLSVQVRETAPAEQPSEAILLLTTAEPPAEAAFAYVVGYERVWAVGNQANPLRNLDAATLRRLFLGHVQNWKQVGGPARPVMRFVPVQGVAARALETLLEGALPTGLAQAVPDPAAALQVVAESPSALTLVPGGWLRAPVVTLPPGVGSWRAEARILSAEPVLVTPIVVYGFASLNADLRALVGCWQQGLRALYPPP